MSDQLKLFKIVRACGFYNLSSEASFYDRTFKPCQYLKTTTSHEIESCFLLKFIIVILGKIDIGFWSNPSRLIEFPCHVRR